uniref:Transmembrane protein n=1 Tax=Fagus sylvatica TaxID=28930 RepID=A0A2N9IRQ2_FAGSY
MGLRFAIVVVWVCVLGWWLCGGCGFAFMFGCAVVVGLRFAMCGIDGGCWLWVAMVVAGMGRLGVLGSHGGYRRGSAG